MGALLVYFVVGSIVAVPFLGYQVLRTRRELNELRAELRRRGLIAPGPTDTPAVTRREGPERLGGAVGEPRSLAPSAERGVEESTAAPAPPGGVAAPAKPPQ